MLDGATAGQHLYITVPDRMSAFFFCFLCIITLVVSDLSLSNFCSGELMIERPVGSSFMIHHFCERISGQGRIRELSYVMLKSDWGSREGYDGNLRDE